MIIIDAAQGTPEWHAARCGRVTASRVADLMRQNKGGVSATRATYIGELVAERLSGFVAIDTFTSKAIEHGKEFEAEARRAYAFMQDADVAEVGFVVHPTIERAGCSPDGLVGEHGLVEFKCPNSATHIATLRGAPIKPDYVKQMLWQMACCERQWCDFVSYDPRMPPNMRLHVVRVQRDEKAIADITDAVKAAISEVEENVAQLKWMFGEAA